MTCNYPTPTQPNARNDPLLQHRVDSESAQVKPRRDFIYSDPSGIDLPVPPQSEVEWMARDLVLSLSLLRSSSERIRCGSVVHSTTWRKLELVSLFFDVRSCKSLNQRENNFDGF
jgi:hypothetical protein